MKFNEKFWVPSLNKFLYKEYKDPKTGHSQYKMRGLMLPFDVVSRNGVLYNKESVEDKHKSLIGRPLMYNHQVDGRSDLPYGHFTDSVCLQEPEQGWDNVYEVPGWYYEADIDPAEKDIIRKLERGDLRHVSIQLVGDKVEEKFSEKDGTNYTEAWVGDIIEGSIVPAPGFLDTTARIMEAFNRKEDVTTTTGSGAISPELLPKKKKEFFDSGAARGASSDEEILMAGIAAELDATSLYRFFAKKTTNEAIKKVMLSVANEEEVHAGEFQKVLKQINPNYIKNLEAGEKEVGMNERTGSEPTQPMMEEDELVKEFMKLGNKKIAKILKEYGY